MGSPYEVHAIDKTCWRIEENGVRAFLLAGTQRALLVDTGFGTGNIREVADSLTSLPVMLVNTHCDRDHIGCNHLYGYAYMHPAEYDRYQYGKEAPGTAKPLWEGDVIDLGGRSLEVVLIPGHTPGSIALLDRDNRMLFSGDSAQAGTIYMFGPGRNIHAYLDSMEKLAGMAGLFDGIYPSHGPLPVTPAILDGLIAGARRILAGEIPGVPTPVGEQTIPVYDVGVAKFLWE